MQAIEYIQICPKSTAHHLLVEMTELDGCLGGRLVRGKELDEVLIQAFFRIDKDEVNNIFNGLPYGCQLVELPRSRGLLVILGIDPDQDLEEDETEEKSAKDLAFSVRLLENMVAELVQLGRDCDAWNADTEVCEHPLLQNAIRIEQQVKQRRTEDAMLMFGSGQTDTLGGLTHS